MTRNPAPFRTVSAGLRFAWETGLRDAARIWTAALVAVAVALGLQVSLPVGAWAASFANFSDMRRAAALGAAVLVTGTVSAAFLRGVLRGPAFMHRRLVPLSRCSALLVDLASVAAFLFVPALAAAVFASELSRVRGTLAIGVLLAGGTTIVLTVALLRAWSWSAGVGGMVAVLAGGIAGWGRGTSLAIGVLLAGAAIASVLVAQERPGERAGRKRRRAPRTLRTSPASVATLVRWEAGWARRLGWRAAIEGTSLAILAIGAAEMAIRNNAVRDPEAALRIAAFCVPFAAAGLASAALDPWARARAWRGSETLLPIAGGLRVRAVACGIALLSVLPLAVLASVWDHGIRGLGTAAAWLVALTTLFILGGSAREMRERAWRPHLLGWAGAAALAGATAPEGALLAGFAITLAAAISLRRAASQTDHPLPSPERER